MFRSDTVTYLNILPYVFVKELFIQFLNFSSLLKFRLRVSPSRQKILPFWFAGYQRYFLDLACGGKSIFSVSQRPKARAAKPREKTLFPRVTMFFCPFNNINIFFLIIQLFLPEVNSNFFFVMVKAKCSF